MVRILHVTSELDGGGIERMLYNYMLFLPSDVTFDFAICSNREGILEEKFIQKGSKVFRYPRIRLGVFKTIRELKKIIKKGDYDIVQVHADYRSFIALFAAKLAGAKIRIAHSHTCDEPESTMVYARRIICTFITKMFATDLFACGIEAGRWVWGKRALKNNKIYIMRNAIQSERYEFNASERELTRKRHNLNDKFVIGNVGRLSRQKNQMFLLEAFKLATYNRTDIMLVLIGGGEDETILKEYVEQNKLKEKVLFWGVRDDVNLLVNAFDLFVLPSLYEGLPVTMVEVQANGLSMLVSQNVTSEIKINDNVEYLPLSKEKWADEMTKDKYTRERFGKEKVIAAGYDIATESRVLVEKYKGMVR